METEAPAPPQSHHGNPRAAATAVTVTAKAVTGKDVDCDFNGTDVTNNAIFVDDQASTTVTFNLVDNTGQNVQFDTSNPFGNQSGHCPKNAGSPKKPCGLQNPPAPTSTSFTMSVDPTNGRAVSYYRLNFTNGLSCDPIIIHD
jgi:hypothetical protein